jgi:hypothetical protein
MSGLINPLAAIIQQASRLPDSGMAANYHQRIGTGNPDIWCLLLDTSGSMDAECKGKERRIDVLRKAVEGLDWRNYKLFTFDSVVAEITSPDGLWRCGGSTALDLALDRIVALKPARTVVISDGEPNSEPEAISSAKRLTGTISTIHIGDDRDRDAIAFMRKLAELGCGSTYIQDLGRGHVELSATIVALATGGNRLMLPPSRS